MYVITLALFTFNKQRTLLGRQWSMVHAHWLQMGGLRLRCTQGEAFFSDGKQLIDWICIRQAYSYPLNHTLETKVWEGVIQYTEFKYLLAAGKIAFPEISEQEIEDRSKRDALSKGLAILQITWFITQLITRACQHLTITEVELTTAALAGMSSIVYLFWWSKPLNARCPIVIKTKELETLLANSRIDEDTVKWTFPRYEVDENGDPIDEDFQVKAHLFEVFNQVRKTYSQLIDY